MAQPHLTILELITVLADKTTNDEEFEKLSTEDIESACARLPDVLAAVRRASNSRTRVNSLPPEILLKIFDFVPQAPELTVFDTVQSVCGPLNIRKVWELRPVTQVCHRWRSLAFNVSSLWSSGFRVPHWGSRCGDIPNNACFLSRCAAGPIQIYVEEDGLAGSNWQALQSAKAPPDYEDRVEELHVLTLDGWKKYGLLPSSLSSPRMGCSLQRLVVRSLHFGNSEAISWEWLGPQSLFSGQTLRLRSLAIIDAPFLPSNPAPALTNLVLFYQMKREMRDTWFLRDLLLFLSATPTLEETVICGLPLHCVEAGRQPTARLDRLRKLSIRAWDYQTPGAPGLPFLLFSHLVIPQSCYLRLDAGSIAQIHRLAALFRSRQWDVPTSNLHCVWGSSPYIMSSLQVTFPSSGGGGIRVDIPTAQRLDAEEPLAEALHAVLATPPFAAAERVWVSGSGIDSACDMRMVHSLRPLVRVRALYVANDPLHEPGQFIRALGKPCGMYDQVQVPFPNLETIYVKLYDQDSVDRLADMVRHRADSKCKVAHLLVTFAGTDDEEVPDLVEEVQSSVRGMVEKVTVLGENDYRQTYGLRTVLPSICTLPGGGLIWTPWTENETTFSLMDMN